MRLCVFFTKQGKTRLKCIVLSKAIGRNSTETCTWMSSCRVSLSVGVGLCACRNPYHYLQASKPMVRRRVGCGCVWKVCMSSLAIFFPKPTNSFREAKGSRCPTKTKDNEPQKKKEQKKNNRSIQVVESSRRPSLVSSNHGRLTAIPFFR